MNEPKKRSSTLKSGVFKADYGICHSMACVLNPDTGLIETVRFLESPNCDARPVGEEINTLVIHAISLPPHCYGNAYIEQFFTNALDCTLHPCFLEIAELRVSAHFLINRQGEITQFVPTHCRAWHAGVSRFDGRERVNDFSIGIELEGCDDDPFEQVQYTSLISLTRCLMNHYRALNKNRIIGHSDISPGRKSDPGSCFRWDQYLTFLV